MILFFLLLLTIPAWRTSRPYASYFLSHAEYNPAIFLLPLHSFLLKFPFATGLLLTGFSMGKVFGQDGLPKANIELRINAFPSAGERTRCSYFSTGTIEPFCLCWGLQMKTSQSILLRLRAMLLFLTFSTFFPTPLRYPII